MVAGGQTDDWYRADQRKRGWKGREMFRNLLNRLQAHQDKSQRIKQFRDAFRIAAADGILTDTELQDLEDTLSRLNLDPSDIESLKVALAGDVISKAIEDRRITDEEERGILEFIRRFNVPQGNLNHRIDEMRRFRQLFEIENGILRSIPAPGLALKKNEAAIYAAWASTAEDMVVDSYYQGGSHGASIRIAKGVTYRVGASKGRKVEKRANVITSTGTLYVTNQRLVYVSIQKPAEVSLEKVNNLQFFSTGVMFGVSNRSKPVYYNLSSEDAEGVAVTVSAAVNQLP
ncbi:hypothetical protein [Deinococcus irradiatisoli]|uniref:hypothetical protein n=1 Tax=Deinococcus irradiatisoli TaxID=2202254 RepID=UPI0011B23B33|nr:hypothetical protein [Deinococcus irradiatisoli]